MKSIRTENFTRIVEDANYRFLEAMEDLVRIRDERGEILFENSAMRNVIKTLITKNKHLMGSHTVFFQFYNEYTKQEEKTTLESEVTLDNILYSVKVSPVFDRKGDEIGFIEVYRDITEERNITNELFKTNKKINDQIILARNIQRSILPKINKFRNINFQYGHVPTDNLSGDLFDVVEINKDKVGVYIADVVGHGISAAMMTMFIRQSMRSILIENPELSPAEAIKLLKTMFSQLNLDVSQYFSILYILIDLKEEKIKYVNAGHNCMPILFNDKHLAYLQNSGKVISTLFNDAEYNEKELSLEEGDRILIYTDGLIETADEDGEFFGEARLVNWIRRNRNTKNIVQKLIEEVTLFRWMEQTDDLAMLYLEIGGN